MSQILETLHGCLPDGREDLQRMVETAIQERAGLAASNLTLRSIIDKQAEEIHKLRDQIYREGAART